MRLTLRTLLAYLDDILDPADKEELSQKIESSEFAEDLVHRTRDTMRRLRLSAPQVVGTGMGLDPNTVAEYLDNVLPPEQVGDYERICLESDVHLAEAAACHHVLTMVLGEPADVDPRARQRMYMIPAEARDRKRLRAEPAHVPAVTTTVVAASVPAATVAAPTAGANQPTAGFEIPEYLRTRSWWRSRGALAGLALVLLVGITLYLVSGFMGWFADTRSDTALTADRPGATRGAENQTATSKIGDASPEAIVPDIEPSTATTGDRYGALVATPPQPGTPITSPPAVSTEPPQRYADSSGADLATRTPNAITDETPAPVVEVPATENVAAENVVPPSPNEVAASSDPSAAIPPPSDGTAAPATEPRGVDEAARIAAATPSDLSAAVVDIDRDAVDVDEAPAGPPELGTYLSGKTVLLRYDEASGAWFRVEPRSAVVAGQRLLALPEFRPKIMLASGVHLDLSGGTQIVMAGGDEVQADGLPAASAEVPAIEVLYGRMILINTSNAEHQVRLKLGPNVGDARLARNATLAVEVERQYVPGNDPRQTPAPVLVRLFAPDGGVKWQDAAGEIAVDKASRWTISEGATSEVVADPSPPEWIDQEPVIHLSEQRFGAPVVESALVSDHPVDIQLLELFKGRDRKEVKSLVARSSIHVGLFAPFVEALRDSEQRPNWRTHIETLRGAMALSPESAERVWRALEGQRGRAAANDLFEMLCGYNTEQIGKTPDEMKVGALARLIDWLEEDSLDYRVLAVHDLWEITGKQLMPNPAASLTLRKQNVRRWRDRLESGELRPVGQP